MKLDTALARLDIIEGAHTLEPNWAASQRAMPDGDIDFLAPAAIRQACDAAALPQAIAEDVVRVAGSIATNEALRALAWHCHHCLFVAQGVSVPFRDWPLLTPALGRDAGLFNVIVLLSGTPKVRAFHRAHGVPDDVARHTLNNLELCMQLPVCRETFGGHWGITQRFVGWLSNHWHGQLYRLGRLQFAMSQSRARLRAFRHRRDGTVVALSGPDVCYRADGQVDGAGGRHDEAGAWTSALTVTDTEILGHPIHPTGYAVRQPIRLTAADWQEALAPGSPVLDIHIPGGSPMDFDACGESLRRALAFFPKHFPDRPFVAFMCHSWILDHQFESLLPPTSNLVRFQREVHLFPIASGSEGTVSAVFGHRVRDITSAPRATTMQRAFARHLETGGHFRSGGCFVLADDVAWGKQVYLCQQSAWV